jgi:asparagine synthase (glutamine-hydrolysing)
VAIKRYWDLQFTGTGDASREDGYLDRLEELLLESVKLTLISDVPLRGVFCLAASTRASSWRRWRSTPGRRARASVTTSVGFAEQAFNELEYARTVANHLGTKRTKIWPLRLASCSRKLAWHLDEPFADSSAIPTCHVSKAAREHVTVALSGD